MSKEKLILSKLLKIAENQQKILERLAQTAPPDERRDENIDHITHNLVPIVASNLGLQGVTVTVDIQPGVPSGGSATGSFVAEQPHTYYAKISGVPKPKEKQFADSMVKMIQLQKPELAKMFSYTFG